jgi:hypothetical protein
MDAALRRPRNSAVLAELKRETNVPFRVEGLAIYEREEENNFLVALEGVFVSEARKVNVIFILFPAKAWHFLQHSGRYQSLADQMLQPCIQKY